MTPKTSDSPYKATDKVYHRRSLLGRLWRRPALLAVIILALFAAAGLGVRKYLAVLGRLPSQEQAHAAAVALDRLIGQPEFADLVTKPIENDLGQNIPALTDVDALLLHIRRSRPVSAEFKTEYRRPPTDPSPIIKTWRNVVDELQAKGFDVYDYPQLAAKGDRMLRNEITERLLTFDHHVRQRAQAAISARAAQESGEALAVFAQQQNARAKELSALLATFFKGTNPADYDLPNGPLDNAQRAVVRALHVTRAELDMLFFLNQSAIDMANDDAGA